MDECNKSFSHPLPGFPLLPLLHRSQVIHCRIFQHREEDKHKTDPQVNVHCFDVGNTGHGGVHPSDDRRHGQHGGYPWKEPREINYIDWYSPEGFCLKKNGNYALHDALKDVRYEINLW